MFSPLKQFVPQSVCLSCDGCCRFKEEDSSWRPKISDEERLTQKIFKENVDTLSRLKTKKCSTGHACQFFNLLDNTCTIYSSRPFECQFYPFLIEKKDDSPNVSAHLNCPYVQEKLHSDEFREYVAYLKEYFQKDENKSFIRNNPALIEDYSAHSAELLQLFPL